MLIGLIHLHRTLAYLVFLLALANVAGSLSIREDRAQIAGLVGKSARYGVVMLGRVNIVVGVVLFFVMQLPWSAWWAWSGLLFWAPVEILQKRVVGPEIELLEVGSGAMRRLLLGTSAQLLVIAVIFGIMTVKP